MSNETAEAERIADLEQQVQDLQQQIERMKDVLMNVIDEYNYHSHQEWTGQVPSYERVDSKLLWSVP